MNAFTQYDNLKTLEPIFLTVKGECDTRERVVDYNMEVSIEINRHHEVPVSSRQCAVHLKKKKRLKEVMISVGTIHLSSSLKYHAGPHPLQTGLSYAARGPPPCTPRLCAVSGGV